MDYKSLDMLHKNGGAGDVPDEVPFEDVQDDDNYDGGARSGYDSYKVVMPKGIEGRYISKSPSQAAKKAVSKYFKGKHVGTVSIVIQKTTQGSSKKFYAYKGTKANLSKPKEILGADGNVIKVVKHTTSVKKMDVPAEFQREYEERRMKKGGAKKSEGFLANLFKADEPKKKTKKASKKTAAKKAAPKKAAKKVAKKVAKKTKKVKGGGSCNEMSCNY
jgi:hypothetical protein